VVLSGISSREQVHKNGRKTLIIIIIIIIIIINGT